MVKYFFTSVNNAYIPKAAVLAESLRNVYRNAYVFCVLSDKKSADIDYTVFDRVLTVEDLDIPVPCLESWVFSHTVVELCTAVKPFAFKKIFRETGADAVIYMDPDTVLYSPMVEVYEALTNHPVVLTPHVSVPATDEDDLLDGEMLGCLRHGVFNLGFLALANYGEGIAFLDWWADRCLKFCYDDGARGLFTDQRWIDLAPCFFESLKVLRLPTYNVATWNLYYREIGKDKAGRITINGDLPLRFFHFSGFDIGTHELMLRKHAPNNAVLREMSNWYIQRQKHFGQQKFGLLSGTYDFYGSGEPVTREMRAIYRESPDLINRFPHPYTDHGYRVWWNKRASEMRQSSAFRNVLRWLVEKIKQRRLLTQKIKGVLPAVMVAKIKRLL